MTRQSFVLPLFLLLWWLPITTAHTEETFPLPAELQPDVDFWLAVFTQIDSDQGFLHDNRSLGVVYQTIDVPESLSSAARQKRISAARDRIKAVLGTLANGKRTNLSNEEARILALWPANVSNATLRAATDQVRFQRGLSDRFRDGLVRSGRWRQYIESEFSALDVPLGLAALPHVESSYNPDARSHVGASGIWQFTRSTARRFMRVDHVLDERNDPFIASSGAARLLAYNYSITGNWPTAITAYNHGLSGIRRAMRRYGDTAYVEILRNYDGRTFGFASRNFYVAFLAAMKVDQDPETYFPGVRREAAEEYAEVSLPGYISVAALSQSLGVGEKDLAAHNRALQPTIWQGSKYVPRAFNLRIPQRLLSAPVQDLLAAVPAGDWSDQQLPDLFHTIVRGDTLSEIATHYDTNVATLVALNSLGSSHRIRAGQQLRLPAAGPAPAEPGSAAEVAAVVEAAVVASVEDTAPADAAVQELAPDALGGGESSEEPMATSSTVAQTGLLSDPSDYSVADNGSIEVQPLETLGHYADWLGIRTQRLRDINGLPFGEQVSVGQRLKLEFAEIDATTFEGRRLTYQRGMQDRFFREHVISGVAEHSVRSGESVWVLSLREYGVPLWLFRQYNPEVDVNRVRPGTMLRFPLLADSDRS